MRREEERVYVIGEKARRKETTRKTNIRMDLVEVEWGDVEWIGLAQDRDKWRAFVSEVMNHRVASRAVLSCIELLGQSGKRLPVDETLP
jgi:hypothetical protein